MLNTGFQKASHLVWFHSFRALHSSERRTKAKLQRTFRTREDQGKTTGSIKEQFDCQALPNTPFAHHSHSVMTRAGMLFPFQKMQSSSRHFPAPSVISKQPWATQLQCEILHSPRGTSPDGTAQEGPLLSWQYSPRGTSPLLSWWYSHNHLMKKMQSNNRTCKTKELTDIISHLQKDDSEWFSKTKRAATRYAIHSTAPTVCFLGPCGNSRALTNPGTSSLSDAKRPASKLTSKSTLSDLGFQWILLTQHMPAYRIYCLNSSWRKKKNQPNPNETNKPSDM